MNIVARGGTFLSHTNSQAPTPADSDYSPTPSHPLHIKLIVTDLDGTMTPTYKTLEAVDALVSSLTPIATDDTHDHGAVKKRMLAIVAKYVASEHIPFEKILHDTGALKQIADLIIAQEKKNKTLNRSCEDARDLAFTHMPAAIKMAEKSFVCFPGFARTLLIAHNMGTKVAIYTNTNPRNTFERLKMADADPRDFAAIMSRAQTDLDRTMPWRERLFEEGKNERDILLASLLRTYEKKKGNPEPVIELGEEFGCDPREILYIGEGIADFESTRSIDPVTKQQTVHCHFALQEYGLKMSDTQVTINDLLREGHPLGYEHFTRQYPNIAKESVVLAQGFLTLNEMIANKSVIFEKAPTAKELRARAAKRLASRRVEAPAARVSGGFVSHQQAAANRGPQVL